MNQKEAVQVESAVIAAATIASSSSSTVASALSTKQTQAMDVKSQDLDQQQQHQQQDQLHMDTITELQLPPERDHEKDEEDNEEEEYQDQETIQLALERKRLQQQLEQLEKSPTHEEIARLVAQYTADYSDDDQDHDPDDEDGAEYTTSSVDSEELDNEEVDSLPPSSTVIFKVLVVGNARCGKTSTIRRYISKDFSEDYISTIGVDFQEKTFRFDNQLQISLQLWDIAGQDRFAKMTRAYFREAKGAIIVCDITRENTMDAVLQWKQEIDHCCQDLNQGEPIPVVLIANKSDLLLNPMGAMDIGVNMQKSVSTAGILEWYRASAKSGEKIEEAFHFLIQKMVEKHRREDVEADSSTSGFDSENESTQSTTNEVIHLEDQPPVHPRNNNKANGGACDCN